MDPEGVDLRRARKLKRRRYRPISRGPNWCWHIDGYDKKSPYGIGIHGCIHGCIFLIHSMAGSMQHKQ